MENEAYLNLSEKKKKENGEWDNDVAWRGKYLTCA